MRLELTRDGLMCACVTSQVSSSLLLLHILLVLFEWFVRWEGRGRTISFLLDVGAHRKRRLLVRPSFSSMSCSSDLDCSVRLEVSNRAATLLTVSLPQFVQNSKEHSCVVSI